MENMKLKTLIVDDEAELRKSVASILAHSLKDYDFDITEAENGFQEIQFAKNQFWDMILMDVRMPEINGLEALTQIKEIDPRTFVVIMTAHSNLNDAILAIKEGAYDYVEKPVHVDKLTNIVKKCIDAKNMISELSASNPIFDDDIESEIVGQNEKMKEVFNLIYKVKVLFAAPTAFRAVRKEDPDALLQTYDLCAPCRKDLTDMKQKIHKDFFKQGKMKNG